MTLADELMLDTPAARPCTHPRAKHQHGTRAAYVCDRCRCVPCRTANTAAEATRSRQRAYGRWQPYVDAEPSRQHVWALMAAGMGWKRVAATAGLAPSTVEKLIYGDRKRNLAPSKRIRPATEKALLAIAAPSLAGGTRIDPTGTTRRVQALVAAGWSLTQIGARIGISSTNMPTLVAAKQVRVSTAQKMRAVYEQLAYSNPPDARPAQRAAITRARRMAAERGWAPPAAWFIPDIDDPNAQPDLDSVRASGAAAALGDTLEDVEFILRTGGMWAGACARLGLRPVALEGRLRRAGRPELIGLLKTPPDERRARSDHDRATTPDLLTQGAARDANEEPRPLRATVGDVLPGRRDPRGRGES